MGSGADPAEIAEQIERGSRCLRCASPHEVVAFHGSGYGDSYVADCVWCLPMSYRPYRIAALRFDDGWHVDRRYRHRLAGQAGLTADLDERALTREWALRWLTAALPHLPEGTSVGPLDDFDIAAAKAVVARHLRLVLEP